MASAQYGRFEYWEERYMHKTEPYDWYNDWDGIKDIVTQHIQPHHKILHAGCGTSNLPFQMFDDGYQQITNMDISKVVIEHMKTTHKDRPMQWDSMDAKKMDYPDRTFDTVIEKGLLDSILCGDRSRIMASRMLEQVHRVLKAGGVYIMITYASPDLRTKYFNPNKWAVRSYQISKPRIPYMIPSIQIEENALHHIYVLAKL